MTAENDKVTRTVSSRDPSLSDEANRLLTDELQEIVGADTVTVPAANPRHDRDAHATHSSFVAGLINDRIGLVVTGLVLVIVVAVASLSVGGALILLAAIGLLVLATLAVTTLTMRLTTETEHASPAVAARLEEEGVGDPDRVLTDLVEDFTAAGGELADDGQRR